MSRSALNVRSCCRLHEAIPQAPQGLAADARRCVALGVQSMHAYVGPPGGALIRPAVPR
ncbi:hypothetical protein ACP26L_22360 [Paenibacillus sp. S-38]|uniref:hypothetical protein n=1 Tax=Paenibacillus sp. S-38 TaxID=3416710 RepID=UPI003CEFDA6E